MFRPQAETGRWVTLGAYLTLALALIPLVGLALASQAEPPLFGSPPMSAGTIFSLLLRTLALALVVSVCSLVMGTWLAWCDTQYSFRGRRLVEVVSILPLAIPSYLLAGVIREVMAPRGILGSLFSVSEAFSGFWPAAAVLTLSCTPYVQLLVRSALLKESDNLSQAARLLGASPWRTFCAVRIPSLRPAWAFALVIVAFYTISDFGAVAVLDCEVLTWALYQNRHTPRDVVTLGALIVMVVVPTMAFIRWIHGQAAQKASVGVAREGRRSQPTGLRWFFMWMGYGLVIIPGFLIPTATIMGWVGAGFRIGMQWHGLGDQLVHTLYYTLFGALLTLLAAMLMAWYVGRHHRGATLVEYGVYLTSGLPGILIAVGIFYVLLATRAGGNSGAESFVGGLESLGGFLLLGYIMRFLSEGYAALKPGVVALDRRVEEAAKTLGASSWRRFREISIPALQPSLFAGAILLIVAIAKELPITLLLTPLGEQTLAYRIFDAQQEGALPESGVPALILLLMVFLVQVGLRERKRDV